MLDVLDLHFDYQDEPLLAKVSFHLPSGGLLHVRGANGSGKTTLVKLISGIIYPSQGQIQFNGQAIAQDLAHYQRQICFVGHQSGINPSLSLRENCAYDLHYKAQDINKLAQVFQLEHYLDFPCGLLSAGQRRQVGLLRLWMTSAKLWLLDEPLVALDESSLKVLMQHIQAHRDNGGAVLLTSHQNLPQSSSDHQEYYL